MPAPKRQPLAAHAGRPQVPPTIELPKPSVVILAHPNCGADLSTMAAIAMALQRQVERDFAQHYKVSATVRFDTAAKEDDWVIGLFKDADQPGALGYHDQTPTGKPCAKVFPLLDDPANVSVTMSHELLEMLADPYLSLCAQSSDGKFWAYEVCDAVEADTYVIDGVKVSNFVTPHYFQPPPDLRAVKLDHLGLVKSPYEVRPGGYMQWNDGSGWNQRTNDKQQARQYRRQVRGRGSVRAAKVVRRAMPAPVVPPSRSEAPTPPAVPVQPAPTK